MLLLALGEQEPPPEVLVVSLLCSVERRKVQTQKGPTLEQLAQLAQLRSVVTTKVQEVLLQPEVPELRLKAVLVDWLHCSEELLRELTQKVQTLAQLRSVVTTRVLEVSQFFHSNSLLSRRFYSGNV